jgi:hypothetical protein
MRNVSIKSLEKNGVGGEEPKDACSGKQKHLVLCLLVERT